MWTSIFDVTFLFGCRKPFAFCCCCYPQLLLGVNDSWFWKWRRNIKRRCWYPNHWSRRTVIIIMIRKMDISLALFLECFLFLLLLFSTSSSFQLIGRGSSSWKREKHIGQSLPLCSCSLSAVYFSFQKYKMKNDVFNLIFFFITFITIIIVRLHFSEDIRLRFFVEQSEFLHIFKKSELNQIRLGRSNRKCRDKNHCPILLSRFNHTHKHKHTCTNRKKITLHNAIG